MKTESFNSSVKFNAEIKLIKSMMDWVRDQLTQVKLKQKKYPLEELHKIEIALEEVLVNIISYAYKKPGGMIDIEFYYLPNEEVIFTVKDEGIPFNPIEGEAALEKGLPLEDRMEGGLGIRMIQKLMDKVEYERLENVNVLTLKKSV